MISLSLSFRKNTIQTEMKPQGVLEIQFFWSLVAVKGTCSRHDSSYLSSPVPAVHLAGQARGYWECRTSTHDPMRIKLAFNGSLYVWAVDVSPWCYFVWYKGSDVSLVLHSVTRLELQMERLDTKEITLNDRANCLYSSSVHTSRSATYTAWTYE